jgi:hypothetical protein
MEAFEAVVYVFRKRQEIQAIQSTNTSRHGSVALLIPQPSTLRQSTKNWTARNTDPEGG